MNTLKYLFLSAMIITITFAGCRKEDDDDNTQLEATLNIISPVDGESFAVDSTITVKAEANAPNILHGYRITAQKVSDGLVIFEYEEHLHSTSLDIEKSFVNSTGKGDEIKIKVEVALDHDQNTFAKEVTIKAK